VFAAAHVSWLNEDRGLLMLDDLLPQGTDKQAKIEIKVPVGWTLSTAEAESLTGIFDVKDIEQSVFLIGQDLRQVKGRRSSDLKVSVTGKWQFSDAEAMEITESIGREYVATFGELVNTPIHLVISKFPEDLVPGSWEADTRGRTVTILSSDMPFKSQSLQRLHEQLRHEMFHLWIPEGVNLTGNYDWFYEGFALYQSLKLGVAVNRLRFEDYLDSLSQAIAIDRRLGGKMSLIDASKNRWTGDNNSVVYARGMLVAFLSDLAMLEASKGKRSTDDIVREVYRRHGGEAKPRDGNEAVMELMRSYKELVPIVELYVMAFEKLDMAPLLTVAGIEAPDGMTLRTVAKPNSGQKKILDKLGYNNWRKLSSTRK
jgi:predicted metalloprotease with PDZ domain